MANEPQMAWAAFVWGMWQTSEGTDSIVAASKKKSSKLNRENKERRRKQSHRLGRGRVSEWH